MYTCILRSRRPCASAARASRCAERMQPADRLQEDTNSEGQLIYRQSAAGGSKFGGLANNIKSSFGVFVSDVVLSEVTPVGDKFEIAFAAVAAVSLVWTLLAAARLGDGGSGLLSTFEDVLELLESVGVVFVIRVALQYVQSSLTSIHSGTIYCATSLVLFFCFDAFGRIGSAERCAYRTWPEFRAAVRRHAHGGPDDTGWARMLRPLASSLSPG
jgi:hypothetical protein